MAEAKGDSPISSLDDVFSSKPESEESSSSSSEETKDAKSKDEGNQKLPVSNASPPEKKKAKPSPKKEDAKDEEEADDEPADEDKSVVDDADKSEAAKDDKEDKSKEKDEAKDKWDSEENPYVKRFKDTSANWQREHQQNLQMASQLQQMQRDMVRLQKIADGTYDPDVDEPKVTPESVAANALNVGKVLASRKAAIEQHGLEKVNTDLGEFNTLFEGHEMVNRIVLAAESPVHEAMRIMDRFRFEKKYGDTPDKWHKNITAEAEQALREKLTAEITEQILGRADKSKNTPRGLHSSRGSNGLQTGSKSNSGSKGATPLKEVFGR